ncbi:MAG: hypothetical protein ACFFB2_14060 [Promethearchaeota archaeon]
MLWNDSDIITEEYTPNLLDLYNELNNKFENTIHIGFSPIKKTIRLQYLEDFNDLKEFFEWRKKFPTELIEGWLIYRRELEGESPFISFKMLNPESNELSEFLIYNIKTYKFNKVGLSPASFKPGSNRRALFDYLMNLYHLPSKLKRREIKNSCETGIRESLGLNNSVNIQINDVYRLKYSKKRIDEFFENLFWRFFEINKYDWRSQWNKGQSPGLNRIHDYYMLKGRSFIETGICFNLEDSKFNIYITDQSSKIRSLKELIHNKNLNSYSKENFTTFYKEFQKINHSGIIEIKNKLSYKTLQSYSIQFGFGKISNQIAKFASESNKEGITRAIAVIMQILKVRSGITTISKNSELLNFLDLSEDVFSEEKWSKIVTNSRNTIDFPDIVIYDEKTKLAIEKVQLKVLPYIPTKFLRYRHEEILSDFLKGVNCYDQVTNTGLNSFRIEYAPAGSYFKSLENLPTDNHRILIHYWGKLDLKLQRFGEVYNAVRLAIYNYKITKKDDIIEFVQKKLKSGKEMLSGRKPGRIDENLIVDQFSLYKKGMTERHYIYQSLIKLTTEVLE